MLHIQFIEELRFVNQPSPIINMCIIIKPRRCPNCCPLICIVIARSLKRCFLLFNFLDKLLSKCRLAKWTDELHHRDKALIFQFIKIFFQWFRLGSLLSAHMSSVSIKRVYVKAFVFTDIHKIFHKISITWIVGCARKMIINVNCSDIEPNKIVVNL